MKDCMGYGGIVDYTGRIDIPPLLVIVRESNEKYIFGCVLWNWQNAR